MASSSPEINWSGEYNGPSGENVRGLRLRQDTRQQSGGDSYTSGYSSCGLDEESGEETEQLLLSVESQNSLEPTTSPGTTKKTVKHVPGVPRTFQVLSGVLLLLVGVVLGPALARLLVSSGKVLFPGVSMDHRWGNPFIHKGVLPSLNLFRYYQEVNFPVFHEEGHSFGLKRTNMPQVDAETGIKKRLTSMVYQHDGFVTVEAVDLQRVYPLQSEVSGLIVFNHLLEHMREILSTNPKFFSRVMLIRTPEDLEGRSGIIPAGSLLILDGHHTTAALAECAKDITVSLRGSVVVGSSLCGPHFKTVHEVVILNGLHPIKVLDLARKSGAGYGQTLTMKTAADHAQKSEMPETTNDAHFDI